MTFRGKKIAPWKWAAGKKLPESSIETTSTKHGRRPLGGQDMSSVPMDEDISKIMPLPWMCPSCGHGHLMYCMACARCGGQTPIGEVNWRR